MKKTLLSSITGIILFSVLFQFSCNNFKQSELKSDTPLNKNEVFNSLGKYDVYVHGSNGVFKLENPCVEGDALCEKIPETPATKKLVHHESVNIYSDGPIHAKYVSAKEKIILTKKQIRNIIFPGTLRPKEVNKGDNDDAGIAIGLILLLVILGLLIIWLLIYLIVKSTNQAAQGSSNGSGSNSGSGSGTSNSGCYIATMVYGSYDAPQVMTLRRFRDEKLSRSLAGRAFIRWYYSWSPGFVEKYNHLNWLHKIIRVLLDGLVKLLS